MPSLPSYYDTGSASVAANGTVVTFQGAGTIAEFLRANDLFGTHVGSGQRIAEVGPATGLTANQVRLAYPWKGPAQTTAAYEVQFTPYSTNPTGTLEELVTLLKSGNVAALAGLLGAGGNKIPRLTGPGTMDTIDSRNLAALAGLGAMLGDRLFYSNGNYSLQQTVFTSFARSLLDDPDFSTALNTLGAGSRGKDIFRSGAHSELLDKAGILTNLGQLANNAVVSVPLSGGPNGNLVGIIGNTPAFSNLYVARTASSSNGIQAIGTTTSGTINLYSTPLTGTTGATGSVNIGAANDGNLYIENRVGYTIAVYVMIMSPSRA